MASMFSYNYDHPARRQFHGREEQQKSANLPSVDSIYANMRLPKADESRSIQSMDVLDQLVTLRPRRLVSKYL